LTPHRFTVTDLEINGAKALADDEIRALMGSPELWRKNVFQLASVRRLPRFDRLLLTII
jgi:hypothetical protein